MPAQPKKEGKSDLLDVIVTDLEIPPNSLEESLHLKSDVPILKTSHLILLGRRKMVTSSLSAATKVKLLKSALEAMSPRGKALHCRSTSLAIAFTSTLFPTATRTT